MSARTGIRRLAEKCEFPLLLGVVGGFLTGAALGLWFLGLDHRILLPFRFQLISPMLLGVLGAGTAALPARRGQTRLPLSVAWAFVAGG
ncbi:MAG TPA: hypothetical protein VEU07_07990, partial [Candidatus Acidoferrum sp.]|nr:hypothetical protein [Candidatus Acidoferrum sp.]